MPLPLSDRPPRQRAKDALSFVIQRLSYGQRLEYEDIESVWAAVDDIIEAAVETAVAKIQNGE